jgi:hypothetical protein
MGITIINVKEFEDKFLIYNRPTAKLTFKEKAEDDKENLTVGQVHGGEVAGKRVEVWLQKIAKKSPKKKGG